MDTSATTYYYEQVDLYMGGILGFLHVHHLYGQRENQRTIVQKMMHHIKYDMKSQCDGVGPTGRFLRVYEDENNQINKHDPLFVELS